VRLGRACERMAGLASFGGSLWSAIRAAVLNGEVFTTFGGEAGDVVWASR
jgi:hypothetical protein